MTQGPFESSDFKNLAATQRLRGYETRSATPSDLILASYDAPDAYFEGLHEYFGKMGYHSQTVVLERYALYWDLIEAKCGHKSPALSVYQEDLNWQSFSYDAIHLRVNQLAIRWADAGVGQGSTVTLLVPMGYQFLLGLLTGLKLGASIGWVSPDGPTYIKHRLDRLGSEFIAANHRHYPNLEGTHLDFDRVGSDQIKSVPPTIQYEAEAIALRLLSPLSQERDTLIELTASQLYHRVLNDLIVVLELNAADRVSMPGLDPSQFQPWGLITTLLAGGTYLHVDAKTLRETPNAWTDYRPTVLGLNDSTRKQFREHFAAISDSLRLWFRDISETLDWQAWDDFQTGFETQRPWGINLLVNAAFGGTLFFSPRADRVPPIDVTVAPGLPWTLLDQSGPGETRRRSTGLYAAPDSGLTEDHHGRLLLSQPKPAELYFIGTIDGVSGARTYPVKEVKEVVCALPSVSACLVLQLDRLMDVSDVPVNLLIFLNRALRPHYTPKELTNLKAKIREVIEFELGPSFVPSQITLSHAYPESSDGTLDESWAQSQFYRGFLELKEEMPIFSTLSALRTLIDESSDA